MNGGGVHFLPPSVFPRPALCADSEDNPPKSNARVLGRHAHRKLAAAFPEEDGRYASVSVTPLREALNFVWDILQMAFVIMLVGVGFVLVIACVNVA